MQRHHASLLAIWREISGASSLAPAVEAIAPLVARQLPIGALAVRRIDRARACVETVASAAVPPHAHAHAPGAERSELEPAQLEDLVGWALTGRVLHGRARALEPRAPGAIPSGLSGDALLAPLGHREAPAGALLLVARRGAHFAPEHVAFAEALAEPLSAALENEERVRALATQQAAAEADRVALLSRLGRSENRETIVGAEAGLASVMARVDRVANSDVPVLVLGETGSGKEVVARAIHQRSRRAGAPFHRVNCGAIPSGLVDSELFGHERGSFTGAGALRKGWFERADGGTLFLDEIGELPLAAQVRLLRILQDGSFERVGGQRALHADVRIVAATHRDLRAMVADGAFREDLWYRLAVFPIELPPLRERPEDIPALATHFALRAATRFGSPPRLPTRGDLELLLDYSWPGNVRELGAVMERAVILGDQDRLDVATALGSPARAARPQRTEPPRAASASRDRSAPPAEAAIATLDDAMRAHIERALAHTRGRVEGPRGAAQLLAINPHTLRARMRKLRIDVASFRG
ncbi:MAG: sigma-54-dependent Fis family transcriptional regulator [Deltaproteobacteria bacterium]|nr:sigma-54-dependent Fis family transcriptional regulator [Deltaproteobacteria bacterium]